LYPDTSLKAAFRLSQVNINSTSVNSGIRGCLPYAAYLSLFASGCELTATLFRFNTCVFSSVSIICLVLNGVGFYSKDFNQESCDRFYLAPVMTKSM